MTERRVLGAISFATAESKRCYDFTDVAVAEQVALCAAVAIRQARLAPAYGAKGRQETGGMRVP